MSLLDTAPPRRVRHRRSARGLTVGAWSLLVALVGLLVLSFLPTGYVIEQPGPVYNTLGQVTQDGKTSPLLSVEDAQTYPTGGALNLLTVQVVGSPDSPANWLQLLGAWFDPARAVVPIGSVFPAGQSTDQRMQQNSAMMASSQQDAEAAAFEHLGYDVPSEVSVASVLDDGAAAGILAADDQIVAVGGTPIDSADGLRAAVAASGGSPVTLTISRNGAHQDVSVTPTPGADGTWLLGVTVQQSYDLPYKADFTLQNVGGPSGGMMFALGIVDLLTPGQLNGGKDVAGTGTISADGTVGPIGGIRQKMFGAVNAGSAYFLAPQANCDEVVGHIPAGLQVFSVSTLDDAVNALNHIADGDTAGLPTCTVG